MIANPEVHLHWRAIPSGIETDVATVSSMPSFHLEAERRSTLPREIHDSLVKWPLTTREFAFEVSLEQNVGGTLESVVLPGRYRSTLQQHEAEQGAQLLNILLDGALVMPSPPNQSLTALVANGVTGFKSPQLRGYRDVSGQDRLSRIPGLTDTILQTKLSQSLGPWQKRSTAELLKLTPSKTEQPFSAPPISVAEYLVSNDTFSVFLPPDPMTIDRVNSERRRAWFLSDLESIHKNMVLRDIVRLELRMGRSNDGPPVLFERTMLGLLCSAIDPDRNGHLVDGTTSSEREAYDELRLLIREDITYAQYLNYLQYLVATTPEQIQNIVAQRLGIASANFDQISNATIDEALCDEYRDIHNLLGALSAYPTLARLTGLSIDLEIPKRVLQESISGSDWRIIVRPTQPSFVTKSFYYCTAFGERSNPEFFWPRSESDEIRHGTLNLATRYELRSIDVDQASESSANARAVADSQIAVGVRDEDIETQASHLSTVGIAVVEVNAVESAKKMVENESRQISQLLSDDPSLPCLYAEDLVIGYRFDVNMSIDPDAWRSICARTVAYHSEVEGLSRITPNSVDEPREEGIIRQGSREFEDPEDPERVPNNTLCVWRDRNLCVPHEELEDISSASDEECRRNLNIPYRPDYHDSGNQPILRYRLRYKFGARVAFANGSSIPQAEAIRAYLGQLGSATAVGGNDSEYFNFSRFEPRLPPDMHLTDPIQPQETPGDKQEHIVVRSGDRLSNKHTVSSRWLVPPRLDTQMAELHGALDAFSELPEGAFTEFDLDFCGNVPRVKTSTDDDSAHAGDTILRSRRRRIARNALPYLPDPEIRGVGAAVVRKSGVDSGLVIETYDWYNKRSDWPNARPLKLIVEAAKHRQDPIQHEQRSNTPNSGELTVSLPPGEVATLKIWSTWSIRNPATATTYGDSGSDRINCGLFQLALAGSRFVGSNVQPAARNFVHALINSSDDAIWPIPDPHLCPSRDIVIVHAVQRPSLVPEFRSDFSCKRFQPTAQSGQVLETASPNDRRTALARGQANGALFEGRIELDRKTTGRVECHATWSDWEDDVLRPRPTLDEKSGSIFAIEDIDPHSSPAERVSLQVNDAGEERNLWHDFKDTKHHTVTYHLTATSRFRNYYPENMKAENFTRSSIAERPSGVRLEIPSSKRPAPPKIDYLVPTYEFERSSHRRGIQTTRKSGIRVWLDRPWYSSGNDEKLAVVFWPPNLFGGPRNSQRTSRAARVNRWSADDLLAQSNGLIESYVTRVGLDPSLPAGELVEVVPSNVFQGYDKTAGHLNLAESADHGQPLPVSVVAYNVGTENYSEQRKQYSVDIGIDITALTRKPGKIGMLPFMRLAFARYQPFSINDYELSPVIVADMIQLHPQRIAVITFDKRQREFVDVSLSGYGVSEWQLTESGRMDIFLTLLSRPRGGRYWRPTLDQTAHLNKVGDSYVARTRYAIEDLPRNSEYAVHVRETRRTGRANRSEPLNLFFMVQPITRDEIRRHESNTA